MEIFKALCASFFNIQSSIFNSEVYFALERDGRGSILFGNENKSKLSFAFLSFFYNFVIE